MGNVSGAGVREFSFIMESIRASRARSSLFRLFRGRHGFPSRPNLTLAGFAAFAAVSSSCFDRLLLRSTSMSFPAATDNLSGFGGPLLVVVSTVVLAGKCGPWLGAE